MKKIIRLTESDLHRIVKESVKRILKEDNSLELRVAEKILDDIQNNNPELLQASPEDLIEYVMATHQVPRSIAELVANMA
jgi:hypothetical protein